ncbi:MAG: TauD/TfdA family dioxygenase [Acidimicrobiales bacterium]
MAMTIEPLTPAIGAEVLGISLASVPDDPATAGAIGDALTRHQVLVFRDQKLDREQHKAFGRLFGELHVHPSKRSASAKGDPEIFTVKADENTTRNNGGRWHMDVSCDQVPPAGSILHLTETPPQGGDTMFANMHLAYQALSSPIKELLNRLDARHDGLQDLRWYGYEPDPSFAYPAATHPVVVAHPVTGLPTLNVNEAFTSRIEGLSVVESDAILRLLFDHIAKDPTFHCRVRWRAGTVVFWDNRAVQHFAIWDYHPHVRRGERVSICGTAPPKPAFPCAR